MNNLLAFDIESLGVGKKLCSVGFAHIDGGRHLINIECDWNDMEPRCKREFWDKQSEELKLKLQTNCVTESVACQQIKDLVETYCLDGRDEIMIVSDNPGYDVGEINALLVRNGFMPLQYTKKSGYIDVLCASSFRKGKGIFTSIGINAHSPELDAEVILKSVL